MKTIAIEVGNGVLRLSKQVRLSPKARLAVLVLEDDSTGAEIPTLAEAGGAFDFLKEEPTCTLTRTSCRIAGTRALEDTSNVPGRRGRYAAFPRSSPLAAMSVVAAGSRRSQFLWCVRHNRNGNREYALRHVDFDNPSCLEADWT